MNSLELANIAFPVFRIGKAKPHFENNTYFYILGKDTDYSDAEYKVLVLDDRNAAGDTLAARRLMLKAQGTELYGLNKAIFFLGDLIKLAKKNTWFIDSKGSVFEYEKTRRVPLVYKKIKSITNIVTGGAIIEVDGLSERFKTLFAPTNNETHAGLLVLDKAHILYGLYTQEYKTTNRAV